MGQIGSLRVRRRHDVYKRTHVVADRRRRVMWTPGGTPDLTYINAQQVVAAGTAL